MVAKLKAVSNKRSPEREALAQAIAEATDVARATAKASEAVECARDIVANAEAKFVEAVAGIEHAKDAQARLTAKAATSGKPAPVGTAQSNARLTLQNAEDAREAATSALATCEDALAESEAELAYTRDIIAKCADAVIYSESAARVLKETRTLQEKLIFARVSLQHLYKISPEPDSSPFKTEAKNLLGFREFASWPGNVEYFNWDREPATLQIAALREALSKNADAEV